VDIPAQCTRTNIHSLPPGPDSASTTITAYHLNTAVQVKVMIHLPGFSVQSDTPTAWLANTEANCCLYPDETTLVEMHSITPVTIGIATLPKQDRDITYCNKMCYLLLTRTDDSIHMQPFYCTLMASGIFVSTDSIMVTSLDIVTWVQSGHKNKDAIFNLGWTSMVKELDKRNKAQCTCDGSTCGAQVRDM
jgi:hypothetical protein